jgi:hypothetical protein
MEKSRKKGKRNVVIISAIAACLLAICCTVFIFLYLPVIDWMGMLIKVSPSLLFCFVIAVVLFIGSIVLGIYLIRHKHTFVRWFLFVFLLLLLGSSSGFFGSMYFLSAGEQNGCIFEKCAWFD